MENTPKPFGKYFLIEKIATGGMAEIYKAKTFGSDGFEKWVAIKKILPHWASDPEFVKMLVDEAKISVLLTHANIVNVLDLGTVENDYFIAMEWVDGMDLKNLKDQVLSKNQKIPVNVATFVAMQIASGLDYAHKKSDEAGNPLNIIHRDISPHNILISHNGDVKITDFGIAKATLKKSFTSTGVLKGKLSYMSPEQVRGETLTPQSDLFSLGLVLFEMLVGQKLFDGDTEVSIIDKIRNTQIDASQIPSDIPDSLKSILLKLLAPQLENRYSSAEALQVDLAQALAQIHPGFLPKDLSQFLEAYRRSPTPLAENTDPKESTSDRISKAKTNISHIPAASTEAVSSPSVPQKKSSLWIWLILLFVLFLCCLGGGGFVVWKKIIQPRLAALQTPEQALPLPTPTKPLSAPPAVPIIPPMPQSLPSPSSMPASLPAESQALETRKAESTPSSQPTPSENMKAVLGQAYIVSLPEGADIFVNDVATGLKTPSTVQNLTLNQAHRIRLSKTGYLNVEAVYTPTSAETQRLDIPLRALAPNTKPLVKTDEANEENKLPTEVAPLKKKTPRPAPVRERSEPLRQTPPPSSPGLWIN